MLPVRTRVTKWAILLFARPDEEDTCSTYVDWCDDLEERLRSRFPRYAIVRQDDDERDGETLAVRLIIESPFQPNIEVDDFEVMEVAPW